MTPELEEKIAKAMADRVLSIALKHLQDYWDYNGEAWPEHNEDGECRACGYESELEWVIKELKEVVGK